MAMYIFQKQTDGQYKGVQHWLLGITDEQALAFAARLAESDDYDIRVIKVEESGNQTIIGHTFYNAAHRAYLVEAGKNDTIIDGDLGSTPLQPA